jgi:hypothetical protein
MKQRLQILITAFAMFSMGALLIAQEPSAQKTKAYTPPKTPWGDPDLQGYWPTVEPMDLQKRIPGVTKGKNANKQGPPRMVMIFDPPDGRMPPYTPEAVKRFAEANGGKGYPSEWRGIADSTEDINIYIRCITRGVVGTMKNSSYNNGNHIIQTPDYFIIRQEMIHETRVIPLDRRPHVGSDIKMYMGDGRGHWEGSTMVVESTNFTDLTAIGGNGVAYDGEGSRHSEALKLTERFTRTDDNTIEWEATIDDPKTWVKPWRIRVPLKQDKEYGFYEYACHEGNYALEDILSGARYEEESKK